VSSLAIPRKPTTGTISHILVQPRSITLRGEPREPTHGHTTAFFLFLFSFFSFFFLFSPLLSFFFRFFLPQLPSPHFVAWDGYSTVPGLENTTAASLPIGCAWLWPSCIMSYCTLSQYWYQTEYRYHNINLWLNLVSVPVLHTSRATQKRENRSLPCFPTL